MNDNKQGQFKLHAAVGGDEDEYGPFEWVPLSMVKGGELKPFKVHLKPLRHIITGSAPAPSGWYKDKHEPSNRRGRPCYSEATMMTPYGGYCTVGCKYCYVNHGYRGYRATGVTTVNPGYPEAMEKYLSKMMISGPAYISNSTEAFGHLESTYHVTERLSKIVLDSGLPLFYLSKRSVPDWAIDNLLANPYNYMQWSVNTSDPAVYRHVSPGGIKLDQWARQVEDLSRQGIYISIHVSPILPGIVTLEDIKNLVTIGAKAGVRHFIFKMVEQVYNNRKLLIDRLAKVPGVEVLDSLLTQTIGGVYTIREDVRLEWWNELLPLTRSLGATMSLCFEFYENGGAGAHLAPWFTTSDQCHGRGVPVHYRPEPGASFQPLPGCYRKGCLYCEEYGTQACRNDNLLEAKALRYKDMREIQLRGRERDWGINDSCRRPEQVTRHDGCNPNMETDAEMWGWGD